MCAIHCQVYHSQLILSFDWYQTSLGHRKDHILTHGLREIESQAKPSSFLAAHTVMKHVSIKQMVSSHIFSISFKYTSNCKIQLSFFGQATPTISALCHSQSQSELHARTWHSESISIAPSHCTFPSHTLNYTYSIAQDAHQFIILCLPPPPPQIMGNKFKIFAIANILPMALARHTIWCIKKQFVHIFLNCERVCNQQQNTLQFFNCQLAPR